MLVEDPHDLRGVHRRAAADGDDDVRLEARHQLGAFLRAGEGRVGSHVRERGEHDALLLEALLNRLRVAVRIEEGIRHDERLLLAELLAKFLERHREAALLLIHLFRRAEPQHVLSSHGHSLDVDEVLDADILRNRVPAPASAAERERRNKHEVVDVADAAEARRHVHEQTAGLHPLCELVELGLLVEFVDPEDRRVAKTAVVHEQGLRDVERMVEILALVHAEDRRELLVAERLGAVRGGRLADEDLRVLGHLEARHLGNRHRALTNDLRIQCAVDEHRRADLVRFGLVEEVAATLRELGLDGVVDLLVGDHRLLRRADHAVVEGLRVDDRVDGVDDVTARVENRRRVAGADAEGRRAGAVGGLHHAGTSRREDDVGLLHEEVRLRQARRLDPADDVLRGACLHGRVQHNLRRRDRGVLGARMRTDHDAVARLEREQRLEDGSRSGVRRRDDGADDADRLGELHHAARRVLLDHAAGLRVLVGVVDVLGRKVVLDDLVLDDAHAGLGDGHLGEGDALAVRRKRRGLENRVHLLLRVRRVLLLRRSHARKGCLEFRDARIYGRFRDLVCAFHLLVLPCWSLRPFRGTTRKSIALPE